MIIIRNVSFGENSPKICIPIVEKNKEKILNQVKKIKQTKADCLEWRCDYFENGTNVSLVLEILKQMRNIYDKPIIFTFRTINEGGKQLISQDEYEQLLYKVSQSNYIDIIDIELKRNSNEFVKKIKSLKPIILSYHNFKETPDRVEMIQLFTEMKELKGDFLKIAVMPQCEEDVDRLLEISLQAKTTLNALIISVSMGELGIKSRLSQDTCITFASLDQGSAPGQISVEKLWEQLHSK